MRGFLAIFLLMPGAFSSPVSQPIDCSDVYSHGFGQSGVYTIYPAGPLSPVQVYCDMGQEGDPDSRKWTVFQRRQDGNINFYRKWEAYKAGFGQATGEYWLGLENIHFLSLHKNYELRVDMEDFEGVKVYAQYSNFSVDPEQEGYRINFSGFKDGGAGSCMDHHNGMMFSTFDKDQDTHGSNCAKVYLSGWWHGSCHNVNPNGEYLWGSSSYGIGINWSCWRGYEYSLKSIVMKMRPVLSNL